MPRPIDPEVAALCEVGPSSWTAEWTAGVETERRASIAIPWCMVCGNAHTVGEVEDHAPCPPNPNPPVLMGIMPHMEWEPVGERADAIRSAIEVWVEARLAACRPTLPFTGFTVS